MWGGESNAALLLLAAYAAISAKAIGATFGTPWQEQEEAQVMQQEQQVVIKVLLLAQSCLLLSLLIFLIFFLITIFVAYSKCCSIC